MPQKRLQPCEDLTMDHEGTGAAHLAAANRKKRQSTNLSKDGAAAQDQMQVESIDADIKENIGWPWRQLSQSSRRRRCHAHAKHQVQQKSLDLLHQIRPQRQQQGVDLLHQSARRR